MTPAPARAARLWDSVGHLGATLAGRNMGSVHETEKSHAKPRRDLADKRLYINGDAKQYPTLADMIGGNVNVKQIRALG